MMFDEYYRMSDGKILCKDCWLKGLNLAKQKLVDQERLKQIQFAIEQERYKYEHGIVNLDDPLYREKLHHLKFQFSYLWNKHKEFKMLGSFFRFIDYTAYYRNVQFISKSQSHYFETVTFPAEQEARRKAEQERICAEQKRIKAEQERQKKETEERKKREEELKPYEEDILNKKKVPCQLRIKVAKETYREEVMLRCVRDSAISVFNALKQNPNITPKVKSLIDKKENSRIYIPPVNNYSITDVSSPVNTEVNAPKEEIGCFGWFMIVVIVMGIIWLLINS